ncbi:MAG TPA: hypothetical protein G4O10_01005 [Dehalococcoidia bacterium]|nr:hypothetical protein [Dehalococcoidia bacterium]
MNIVVGIFLVLHGLVHLLYFGHGRRLFEIRPGLLWPDGSWAFSKLFGDERARLLASILCVLAAIVFVVEGTGIFAKQTWWHPVIAASAIFSAVIFILFWDGKRQMLDGKGLFAILINMAILVAFIILQWPDLGF